jgi:hypothetical protein
VDILGIIGLSLSFIGATIIFFFGLPPRVRESGARHLLLEGEDKEEIKKGKRYRKLSKLGLLLLAVGFIFQILGKFT